MHENYRNYFGAFMKNYTTESAKEYVELLKAEIAKAFVGQEKLVEKILISMLAGGHVLLEGVPGLGKTLLVRAIAKAIGGESKRVQFTPDLMPSDITGNIMLNYSNNEFVTKKGPIFCNLFIADEINRSPAKTQSALFEAMQEYQVSLDGTSHTLPQPFVVLATQNPYEHEGTYPLPDAQKDRFLMKVIVDYPNKDEEINMISQVVTQGIGAELFLDDVSSIMSPTDFIDLQKFISTIKIDASIIDYAVRLVQAKRSISALQNGAGPRGGLALIRCGRARALMQGRGFVLPDDVKAVSASVLAHRITLSAESELEGLSEQTIIDHIIAQTETPRS
jgi:MoxR-like ATPase